MVPPLGKTRWRFLRKTKKKKKKELPYDSEIPLLGMHLEKSIIQKGTCTLMFKAAPFTIDETQKQLFIHR